MKQDYLDQLGVSKNWKRFIDWYKVNTSDFVETGRAVLNLYDNSPHKFIMDCYEQFNFNSWQFSFTPRQTWSDVTTMRIRLDAAAIKFGVKVFDDFYQLTNRSTRELVKGGSSHLFQKDYFEDFVLRIFPFIFSIMKDF